MEVIRQHKFQKLLNRNILFPIGFGVLSVVFFTGIVWYLLSLTVWVEKSDATTATANTLLKLMVDQETGVRGYLLTRSDEYLQPYQRADELLPATLDKLRQMIGENTGQQQRLEFVNQSYKRWHDYAESAIALRNRSSESPSIASPIGKQLMDKIRNQVEDLLVAEADAKALHSSNARMYVTVLGGSYFVISLLLSSGLALFGRRQVTSLVLSYEKLLDDVAQKNSVLQDEEWLRIGELGLAEQIIGQLPLPILCQNVLGYLAGRIGILVGALYVLRGDEYFQREANYGFSKDNAQREQQFLRREGLVGQAAAEKRIIHLSEVPVDYLKVNSGFGEASPLHILLVPIHAEAEIIAVLELGLFRAVQPRDLVFLERIAENIGAAIVAANYRRRLHDALLEMQQLNDEMQAQQEELRATNEELEEQAQFLEESQQRLERQHVELEEVNNELEGNNEVLRSTRALLEERALQLEQASRYKSEFLANMSHELRTPLNSALILSKLLADNAQKNLTDEQVRFASAIHSAGQDLLALINDVLDLSKVEAGKIDITVDDVAMAGIAEMLRAYFEPLAEEKSLEFILTIAANVPEKMRTDRQRLEQILRNLLSNAFKFTAQGSIRLSIEKSADDALLFAVSDTGIGISTDVQELIFEPFQQIDAASTRKYGGAGLGLSISRDLARLLGGTLSVRSVIGEGSTFILTIPIELRNIDFDGAVSLNSDSLQPVGSLQKMLLEPGDRLGTGVNRISANVIASLRDFDDDRERLSESSKTILVVEDEINFARILYDLAHELKYDCLVATSAVEAFDLVQQYSPIAVLLDMKLPDHSGLSVLARLKEEPLTRHIPVHVISVEERSAVALRMGAVGYMLKPVTHDQLRALFADIEKNLAKKMKHVLIVEDFAQHTEGTARLISDEAVTATTVATGAQALKLLKERVFDCMITDFDLPDMTAIQLLSSMTSTEICSFPPVVVYSSRNLKSDEEDTLLRHSHSIIIKGVRSPERLLDEVTLFLHRVEADLSDEKQRGLRHFRGRDRVFEGRTILVVDDDVRNIFALTSALEGKGAKVEIGRNGFDAIKKLNESEDIDLVLMDIMMPEMDGYEAMEKIRQDRRFAKLPIIAVTAKAMRDDQERCLRAGANDYVAKPINLERLISLIRVWLPQVQRL